MKKVMGSPLKLTTHRNDYGKRFKRKPAEKLQRSGSRNSYESINIGTPYIKTPSTKKSKQRFGKDQIYKNLASSIITASSQQRLTSSKCFDQYPISSLKLSTFQIDLKNQQTEFLEAQCRKYKDLFEQEKQKRKKFQVQKKQINKQVKQLKKEIDKLKIEIKKNAKQKQYLAKQIQFLERINYDQKTRNLQSYREKYLENEIQKLKEKLIKGKSQNQQQLQKIVKNLQQQKYTIQSHYKALKIANQCILKQLNYNNQNITQIILHSQEYKNLRQKYVKFLDQYKNLRTQYWQLKSQINTKKSDSSIFSFTISQASLDISTSNI